MKEEIKQILLRHVTRFTIAHEKYYGGSSSAILENEFDEIVEEIVSFFQMKFELLQSNEKKV